MKTIALAAHFAPYLKRTVQLATIVEGAMATHYAEFIREVKLLCADFGTLCRAGDADEIIKRLNHTLYICIAVQKNTENKVVN